MRSQINKLALYGLVVIPTVAAVLFYMLFAAPRYVSEAQYLVRSVSSQRATGLESLFRTFGIARTVDDSYAVEKYILSKDMLSTIAARLPLREIFSRKEADIFSRFHWPMMGHRLTSRLETNTMGKRLPRTMPST